MHPVKVKENGVLKTPFTLLAHEPQAQYIISKKPGFIVRWALLVFVLILVIVIVAASTIRYPEIVLVKATVTNDSLNAHRVLLTVDEAEQQKIQEGQPVRLQLNDYPRNEFGFLQGTVAESTPIVKVDLLKGPITSNNKQVQIINGSKAEAMIVVRDMSLLSRLFHNPRPSR